MPVSHPNHLPPVLHIVHGFSPRSVLDVGVGIGAVGLLVRQMLDISRGNLTRDTWSTRLEGVEIFPAYRNPVWDYAYDRIHEMDVHDFLSANRSEFDLILCCDVLEHFPKNTARELAGRLLARTKCLIATTPTGDYPQGAWFGNEAEAHHCNLGRADFPSVVAGESVGITSWFVCSDDAASVVKLKALAAAVPKITARTTVRQRLREALRRLRKRLPSDRKAPG